MDQQTYEHFTRLLRSPGLLDGPGKLKSLAFNIALKEAQHKIKAFRAWHAALPSTLTCLAESQNGPALGTEDCQSWALINSSKVCDFSKLSKKLQSNGLAENRLCPFHQVLHKASTKSHAAATYIFQWKIPSMPAASSSKSPLASLVSGWGTSLDIKKLEYLTLDDRPMESASSDDPSSQIILDGQKQQETQLDFSEQGKLKPLKTAEIFNISCGAKATQHILSSPSPLLALRCLTKDFAFRLSAHNFANE
ncbi:hypothetical protein PtA15_13A372 [Puccinia triticina]|uniref:UGGT thioredoxin-like domain-containing protein n=1 Tax=Puccinia triticina TaxID=208348 RepID=A0ABY7D7S3_9BASI|nr:uncharacterized protein PtA15_13A372 [Puccinia triticina]WAQ90972.1 hypothetical protein PtA15_13A372 [Puccinia triticina]